MTEATRARRRSRRLNPFKKETEPKTMIKKWIGIQHVAMLYLSKNLDEMKKVD